MPPKKSALGPAKAGVSKERRQEAEQDRKKKRDELQQKLDKAVGAEQEALQAELEKFDEMDETWDQVEVKTEAPTDDGRPSTSLLGATDQPPPKETNGTLPKGTDGNPLGEGNSNSNASGAPPENRDTPMDSVEGGSSELPIDLDSEPLLISFSSVSIQDNDIPIESVARRSKFSREQRRETRDFINMHGPKYCARYTIDSVPYLPDGKKMEDLPDVSNPMERHIDNPGERRTYAQVQGISAVAWQYDPAMSKEARLALLDPAEVKKILKYNTIKERNEAIRAGRLKLPPYPQGHVRVTWKDKSSSWETASAVRGLSAKNTIKIEKWIYELACQQETNHEKWLNKLRPDKGRSPTLERSGLRDETPGADAVQPTQPRAAGAFGYPTPSPEPSSATRTPPPALAQDTAERLQAYAVRYKKARGLDPSTLLSEPDRTYCMMEFQGFETLRLQAATVVF